MSRSDVETYRRDGAVVLRGVVSPHEIELLTTGIDEVLATPSPRAKVASSPDDPGFFIEDFCTWREHAAFAEFVRTTSLGDVAAQLTDSKTIRMYHDHVLVKEARTRQRTPWHQDQPYYDVEGRQNVSFWIPVDPVNVASCLELVSGTHHGPWLMPRSFLTKEAKWFPEGSLGELPDIDANRDMFDIKSWSLEPGDAIAFHMLTVHGAPGVSGDGHRRVFSLRVLGDDMVYAPREWTCSPDFSRLFGDEDPRTPGEPLSGPWFPRLFPR
ncbi:MAG: phytanoyl-CoA dioxygenase [Acidimicrobiales bacterium mtb01]|nr:phytanoyl-CoA dioxygenase family protein [Actinomycetota bacterium]TEX46845.1 MAG: phytanoyl-CoA dioxygenase [Acidimicrobiales bacterium mtb01]